MSVDSNVRSNPTGEVGPRSHKCAPKQARSALALPREDFGASPAALERQYGLPHASSEGILALEPAPSWEYRLI